MSVRSTFTQIAGQVSCTFSLRPLFVAFPFLSVAFWSVPPLEALSQSLGRYWILLIVGTVVTTMIASRRLFKGESQIHIELFAPIEVKDNEWRCDFKIIGLTVDPPSHAFGTDPLQALTIAIEGIRIKLESHLSEVSWDFGEEAGEVGLPRLVPLFSGASFRTQDIRHH